MFKDKQINHQFAPDAFHRPSSQCEKKYMDQIMIYKKTT
jgi:hypothetical protein